MELTFVSIGRWSSFLTVLSGNSQRETTLSWLSSTVKLSHTIHSTSLVSTTLHKLVSATHKQSVSNLKRSSQRREPEVLLPSSKPTSLTTKSPKIRRTQPQVLSTLLKFSREASTESEKLSRTSPTSLRELEDSP